MEIFTLEILIISCYVLPWSIPSLEIFISRRNSIVFSAPRKSGIFRRQKFTFSSCVKVSVLLLADALIFVNSFTLIFATLIFESHDRIICDRSWAWVAYTLRYKNPFPMHKPTFYLQNTYIPMKTANRRKIPWVGRNFLKKEQSPIFHSGTTAIDLPRQLLVWQRSPFRSSSAILPRSKNKARQRALVVVADPAGDKATRPVDPTK